MVQDDDVIDANPEPFAIPERSAQRVRSEIEFPYSDLEDVIGLAKTIHSNACSPCDDAELAAWMNMSEHGGTYRARRSAARIFGLVETAQGRLSLTALGRRIVDESDRGARVEAFLKPALFAALYEQYHGQSLPPTPTIERHIERLGVPPKQVKRARQVFQHSAHYAAFVDGSTGRFRKPGTGPVPDQATNAVGQENKKGGGRGGAGDGGGGSDQAEIDPIILGLLARLPKAGEVWPEAERKLWLDLLSGTFKLIYKDTPSTSGPHNGE